MLYRDKNRIGRLYIGGQTAQALYRGAVKIWQSLRSCFSAGYWDDTKPWLDDEGWKDN